MSCFYPKIAFPTNQKTESGKTKYSIQSLQSFVDPVQCLKENEGSVLIPCGKCRGCRIDYSRSWADRMMLELESAGSAVFLTLTYDSEHVNWIFDDADIPIWQTLDKRDWQLFMKKLRRKFSDKKLTFFCCGEYGEKTLRPHMHAVVFGLGLDSFPDLEQLGRNKQGDPYYKSDSLFKVWNRGYVLLADVTWEVCAYVARYVTKKNGKFADYLDSIGVEPEFCLMSRRPGLGSKYLEDHPDALDFSTINLSTPSGGRKISVPRYYLKKMELTDPESYVKMKEVRKQAALDSLFLKMQNSDLDFFEYCESRDFIKKSQTVPLMRDKI